MNQKTVKKENRIMKKISRKSFLKLAAATAAGTAMAPALMGCAWP